MYSDSVNLIHPGITKQLLVICFYNQTKEDRRLRASGWQSGDETASESDFGDEENDVDDSDDVADSDDDHIEVDVCVEDDERVEDEDRVEDDERVEDDVIQRENVFAADSDDTRILNDVTKSDVYVTESNEILSGDDPGNENEIPAVATREDSDDDDAREHDLMNENAATMTFENPDDVTSQPNYDPTYEVSNVRVRKHEYLSDQGIYIFFHIRQNSFTLSLLNFQ